MTKEEIAADPVKGIPRPLPDKIGHCDVVNGYNEENTRWLVEAHNKFRSEMARGVFLGLNGTVKSAKAANMKKISWSCKLQKSAQSWAVNGPCNTTHSGTGGENMWLLDIGTTSVRWYDPQLDSRINGSGLQGTAAWSNEFFKNGFRDYVYTDGENGTGHATASAWADTDQIGCGYNVCPRTEFSKGFYWHRIIVVCQFRPTGNIIGYKTYKFGEPCSQCDKGFTCEKTGSGLCVPE